MGYSGGSFAAGVSKRRKVCFAVYEQARGWEKILVLEPSAMLQRRLAEGLEQQGENCVCFRRASALLRYLQTEQGPVAVIADCFLPDMDLFTFVRQYRELVSCRKGCRLIFTCTESYPGEEMRLRVLSSGADYYMIKPYTAQMLLESLRQLYSPVAPARTPSVRPDVVEYLKGLGLSAGSVSFWYLASAVQMGVVSGELIPQKTLYIELSRMYQVSPQGVESGLRRAARTLTQLGVFPEMPSPKQLVVTLVIAFKRE